MKKSLFILSSLAISNCSFSQTHSDTMFFTGSEQMWVVPCGAQNIQITTYGAQGAAGSSINPGVNSGGQAGLGNKVVGSWSMLSPTDTIYVFVGGRANANVGGYNGGGNGVNVPAGNPSGGGGGATDVRWPSNALSDRIQVAGGGGGGGNAGLEANMNPITGGDGGNGGGNQVLYGNSLDGQAGTDVVQGTYTFPSATGGTTSGVGIHGNGCGGFLGLDGSSNIASLGGNGGQGNNGFGVAQTTMSPSGGGGGGGYIGGNGGGGGSAGTAGCAANGFGPGGGGAAGSNYFDGPVTGENGIRSGDGMVVINYDVVIDSAQIDESFAIPCVGQSVLIYGTPANGTYQIIQGPAGDINDGEFTPSQETTYTVVYSKTVCGVATSDTVQFDVTCDVAGLETNTVEFSVYPNPAKELIAIESSSAIQELVIVDVYGKTVKSITKNFDQVSISDLTSGVYFIQVKNENKQLSKIVQLIKE